MPFWPVLLLCRVSHLCRQHFGFKIHMPCVYMTLPKAEPLYLPPLIFPKTPCPVIVPPPQPALQQGLNKLNWLSCLQVHSYRSPVLFTGAAKAIPTNALLVEIGPHSILRSPLRQSRPDLGYVGTMKKGDCAAQTLSTALGDLWRRGVPVHWKSGPVPTNATGTEGMLHCCGPPVRLLRCPFLLQELLSFGR